MIKKRLNFINFLITIFFIIISYQLFSIQIIHGSSYEYDSKHKLLKEMDITAPRGNIYDTNGVPLAVNRISYAVKIAKTAQSINDLNRMLLNIINILTKNNDTYKNSFANYLKFPLEFGPYLNNDSSLKRWKNDMVDNKDDIAQLDTPQAIFNYLKNVKFKINPKYSDLEAYKIMILRYELLIQGYSIYDAFTIADDVSYLSIAELEENKHIFPGISTYIEPKRKYIDAYVLLNNITIYTALGHFFLFIKRQ